MIGNKSFPVGLVLILVLAIGLIVLGLFVTRRALMPPEEDLPKLSKVTDFDFDKAGGGRFDEQDLVGEISVVDFIFTSCGDECPIMTARMGQLYHMFQHNPEIRLVSISVDPQTDTPAVLADYAKTNGVTDDRWVFLSGPLDEVSDLMRQGFLLTTEDLPEGHSTKLILVDQHGWVRGYYDSTGDLNPLVAHIKQLAKAKS
jgi:protein SCO1/2